MKITKHISFYFLKERIQYVNKIIDETNRYGCTTDIFIHTNIYLEGAFAPYTNGRLQIVVHDLSKTDPFYLTWKCRDLMREQQHDYDLFMYVEDDILVPFKAVQYWLQHNEKLIELNYNLGFVRIEVDHQVEFITDLYGEKLDTLIHVEGAPYCVNNKNPYCAFWIYTKNEFSKFVNSPYYDPQRIAGYGIREQSAVGLHGLHTPWYKNTLIPIIDNKLAEACKIYHLPNNYVLNKNTPFATIPFDCAFAT
jgi:hypothetical protein